MKPKLPQKIIREKLFVFVILFFSIISVKLYANYFQTNENPNFSDIQFQQIENGIPAIKLENFNPNSLTLEDWEKLGFSEKQAKTILKYKQIVGGEFTSKEQLKKCYSISPEKFAELQPYILLPESIKSSYKYSKNNWKKKELNIHQKFNPDLYSEKDWENLGFSEKQSAGIVKYKKYLGGSFVSKEKLKECYMINEENYQKLAPFLILPEKTPADFKPYKKAFAKEKINYQNFDPNSLDLNGWMKLGFSEKQAQNILNYKERFCKGSFKNLEEIAKCYMISSEKFEEMKPFMKLNPENILVKTTANLQGQNSNIKTDFSKIDLNKITFQQLKEFGFTDKAAGSFLGFRKKLNGFKTKDQILQTYNIDKDLTKKLLETAFLQTNPENK